MLRTGFFTVVYLGCEDVEVAGSVDISDGRRNPHLAGELIGLSWLGGGARLVTQPNTFAEFWGQGFIV